MVCPQILWRGATQGHKVHENEKKIGSAVRLNPQWLSKCKIMIVSWRSFWGIDKIWLEEWIVVTIESPDILWVLWVTVYSGGSRISQTRGAYPLVIFPKRLHQNETKLDQQWTSPAYYPQNPRIAFVEAFKIMLWLNQPVESFPPKSKTSHIADNCYLTHMKYKR